ncbi:MAG: HRDC domain-containing protein [Bacilli bacterium]|jgi:ribonuclease D|nr:HRDC domain-containing protein [Bacilli bacterium]
MSIFSNFSSNKITGPVFIKDFNIENNENLKKLNELIDLVGDDQKPIIEEQIKYMSIGLEGEKNVHFELKHSYLPILCLHDIRLEYNDLTSQFDYIIICPNLIMVLETKKLVGDIQIDSEGNFTRIFKDFKGTVYKKEGMYSPISQNQKHVDLLQRMLIDNKLIKRLPIYSLVVVANPKTIIDKRYAPTDVKNSVVKYDQLKNELTKRIKDIKDFRMNESTMYAIADFIMKNDKPIEMDYVKMFNLKIKPKEQVQLEEVKEEVKVLDEDSIPVINDDLYEKLKNYRIQKAKEKNIPLYYVYNNKEMEDVVLNQPTTKEQLLSIKGFGEKKWEDFGNDIIEMVKSFISNNTEYSESTEIKEEKAESEDRIEESRLVKELKKYRYRKSQEENIPPYLIFNNKEMNELCDKLPHTLEELLKVKGFKEEKVEKYGKDIIEIISKYKDA